MSHRKNIKTQIHIYTMRTKVAQRFQSIAKQLYNAWTDQSNTHTFPDTWRTPGVLAKVHRRLTVLRKVKPQSTTLTSYQLYHPQTSKILARCHRYTPEKVHVKECQGIAQRMKIAYCETKQYRKSSSAYMRRKWRMKKWNKWGINRMYLRTIHVLLSWL